MQPTGIFFFRFTPENAWSREAKSLASFQVHCVAIHLCDCGFDSSSCLLKDNKSSPFGELFSSFWCNRQESNLWPQPSQGCALSSWATGSFYRRALRPAQRDYRIAGGIIPGRPPLAMPLSLGSREGKTPGSGGHFRVYCLEYPCCNTCTSSSAPSSCS